MARPADEQQAEGVNEPVETPVAAAEDGGGEPAAAPETPRPAEPSAAELQMKMQAESVLGEEKPSAPAQEGAEGQAAAELRPPAQLPPPVVSVVAGAAAESASSATPRPADETASAGRPAEARKAKPGEPACASCGASIRARDKFCIWCGEKQPSRVPPPMKRCPECRTELPVDANFCYVCGNDVGMHPRKRIRVPAELFEEEDPELYPRFEI